MLLLTIPDVKTVMFLAENYVIFLKNFPNKTWNSFNPKFEPPKVPKVPKDNYQTRKILALFCESVAQIFT